jgi:FtsP/CotA-like multicopper oxidase with cupredoxin domain
MKTSRRGFMSVLAAFLAGTLGIKAYARPLQESRKPYPPKPQTKEPLGKGFLPVEPPDLPKLPYKMMDGRKVFHLVAEPVKREFIPGYVFDLWGFNGCMPGPTIEVREGDRVRIIFENRLPESTSIHWHGLEVPIEMDGVPGITQDPIPPGGTFTYEFTLHQNGTYFYHSHMPMQEMMGMIGLFIIHPEKPHEPRVDKDFGMILQEWAILPNNTVPNSSSMEFNWLTINGKAGAAATPLLVRLGDRVRLRFVNLGMDHHPIHLHGHQWYITGTEGGRIPETAWYPNNTVLVGVAQARDVEFVANNPGDWMLHCHLPHHMMNHMVSMVGPAAEMGSGMRAGLGMEEGMGMVKKGHALSEELGPGMGRGMGLASAREKAVSNLVGMPHGSHSEESRLSLQEKRRIPGYPQDMWMPMDERVAKPETRGLRPGWSGAVQGMMTLVRVLSPEEYGIIVKEIQRKK